MAYPGLFVVWRDQQDERIIHHSATDIIVMYAVNDDLSIDSLRRGPVAVIWEIDRHLQLPQIISMMILIVQSVADPTNRVCFQMIK